MNVFSSRYAPAFMLLSGFTLWSAAFLIIYMAQATGCHLGWHQSMVLGPLTLQRAMLIALFLLACGLHVVLMRGFERRDGGDTFAYRAGRTLALSALVTSVMCFSVVFWLTAC